MDEKRYCAETFNATIAALALSTAWDIGLLDELHTNQRVDVARFAARNNVHRPTLNYLLVAMSSRRIVELDADRGVAVPGPGFADAFLNRGFFYWLTRGCGDLLTTLPSFARNRDGRTTAIHRDARAISVACRTIARSFFDEPLLELLDGVDAGTIADLGCGSGDRIVMLAERMPEARAIGIDIAGDALTVAKAAVSEAGLEHRVRLVQDNVLTMTPDPGFAEVDLVTCFLMGHDFWPREQCVRTLRRLRDVFPNVRNVVLGDTCRSTGLSGTELPMFTLGFETVHAVMDQYLPTLTEWDSVLDESGWHRAESRFIDLPAFSFIHRLTAQ
ncbi:MAG TPA: methyltransferase domain-containing protein [Actinophytocola sp.]|nr:methyltransferase domain-containing protein [Actinophytocola sp.]